jgi:hypothetical protein
MRFQLKGSKLEGFTSQENPAGKGCLRGSSVKTADARLTDTSRGMLNYQA